MRRYGLYFFTYFFTESDDRLSSWRILVKPCHPGRVIGEDLLSLPPPFPAILE